jgi:hypothetical protein
MALKCRVAVLTHDMVHKNRSKFHSQIDIELWLQDQGFNLKAPIGKSHNWKDKRFTFVQDYDSIEEKLGGFYAG